MCVCLCAGEKSENMRRVVCVRSFSETPSTLHSNDLSLSHSRAVALLIALFVCVPVPANTQAFGKNGTKAQQFSLHFLRNDVCFHINTDEQSIFFLFASIRFLVCVCVLCVCRANEIEMELNVTKEERCTERERYDLLCCAEL